MRHLLILSLLAPVLSLAACGENAGWNPNYSAINNGSDYARYLQQREAALHGRGAAPAVIPVQLPAQAPTAADIAGTTTTVVAPVAVVHQPGARVVAQPVPDLARYANHERQVPGQAVYQRTGGSTARAAELCRAFGSAEAAQRTFILAGGPVIDPRGLDPDGDGFVCGWDPRPYRKSGL